MPRRSTSGIGKDGDAADAEVTSVPVRARRAGPLSARPEPLPRRPHWFGWRAVAMVRAVTPYLRLVASSSAPRNSSNTTVIFRRADHPPFPTRPAAARSSALGDRTARFSLDVLFCHAICPMALFFSENFIEHLTGSMYLVIIERHP